MSKVRTFSLYDVLGTDSSSEDEKLQLLAEFKGHVKKELVHEASIPQYFECLCDILNKNNGSRGAEKISVLCHSTLCYLVKRVAMQCPTVLSTETIRMLMIPLLRTVHSGSKLWLGSVKALEAVYLAQPVAFEQTLENSQLQGSDRVATLLLTDELVQLHQRNNRNPLEILNKFTSLFLGILNEPQGSRFQDYELIRDILAKYYTTQSIQEFARRVKNPDIKQLFEVAPEIPLDQISVVDDEDDGQFQDTQNSVFDMEGELRRLLKDQLTSTLPTLPKNYNSFDALRKDLEHLVIPFASAKETEHNWRQRQESMIALRGIIAGNASLEFVDETVAAFREYQIPDCISKAVSSLRTSLSMHGCQLVKEMARNLQAKINPIADGIFLSLKVVLSATKKLSSQNAFYAACVLLTSMHFHSRTFQSCFLLSKDKNVAPRCYAALFLRLFLIRFNSKLDHCVIYIEEWINRSATDAQTKVRESMRVTFWYYYKVYPSNAQKLLDGFPSQIRRAVESSVPQHLGITYTSNSVDSTETSRRSSMGPSRTPSYAGPTHSSHVQRLNSMRASNGYQSSSRNRVEEPGVRKVSGSNRIGAAAARKTSTSTSNSERVTPPRSSDDHTQIDLTGEITQNHSSTLIKKYMQRPVQETAQRGDSGIELENIIRCLSSEDQSEKELGIQLLQNVCLIGLPPQIENLKPAVVQLVSTMPQILAPLLQLPTFLDLLSTAQVIESFGINNVPVEALLRLYTKADVIYALKRVFDSFFPVEEQLPLHYLKYGRQILDYGFDILTEVAKDDLSLNEPFLKLLINRLFELYGKDFDLTKYFNALSCVFAWGKDTFIVTLEAAPIFLQSNIARELEKRDPIFRSSILGSHYDHTGSNLTEDKLFTELTMINPLTYQRSTSGDSVAMHDLKEHQDENIPASKSDSDDEFSQDPGGFTKFGGLSKLTELTRVVSLYEHHENDSSASKNPNLDSDGDARMRSESVELTSKSTDVDLSDIFNGEKPPPKDTTVKFNDIPSLIQEHDHASLDTDNQSDNGDTDATMNTENRDGSSTEKDKVKPEAICTIHLAKGINENELPDPNSLSSMGPIALEKLDEIAETFDFFESLSSSVALRFALHSVAASSTVPYRLENLTMMIAIIRKGSFTDRDLKLLITFLMSGAKESSFVKWFRAENGYPLLLEIHDLLLRSLHDSPNFPETLASKCLLMSACLFVLDSSLPGISTDTLKQLAMEYAWGCQLTVVKKLDSFEDESYVICEELRDYMISRNIVKESILEKLAAELDMKDGTLVQQTFVLASLSVLSRSSATQIGKDFVEDVSERAVKFIESDHSELRKESTLLLSSLYRLATADGDANWHILKDMPRGRAELITSLHTNWNA